MLNTTSFENFVQGWMVRQQQYLDRLLLSLQNDNLQTENQTRELVEQVLLHYQQYYQMKSIAIRDDVFLMFSPPWFSKYEQAFLWIAGFKPSLLFRVVTNGVTDLSAEQVQSLERLKMEIGSAERELSNDFARVQESMAEARLLQLAIGETSRVDGEMNDVEEALRTVRDAVEVSVGNADMLRATTARDIVMILSPPQAVKFLATVAQLQLKIRAYGFQRDSRSP